MKITLNKKELVYLVMPEYYFIGKLIGKRFYLQNIKHRDKKRPIDKREIFLNDMDIFAFEIGRAHV